MSEYNQRLLDIYYYMVAARKLDELEENYSQRGIAPFQVSGGGHESCAVLAPFLIPDDWLHLHYRDKALMLSRGITIQDFLDALLSNADSISKGRQMSAHPSNRETNLVSMVCPVGNNALHAVGIASEIKSADTNPLVICAMGEGTTQQGEVFEGIAESIRSALPVLFFIEDNAYAISTETQGKIFYSTPDGELDEYCGVKITRINGWDVVEALEKIETVVDEIRTQRKPQIVVLYVKRLVSHTSADSQKIYKSEACIEQEQEDYDPIKNLRRVLIDGGLEENVVAIETKTDQEVKEAGKAALNGTSPEACYSAKRSLGELDITAQANTLFSETDIGTMRESINRVLHHQLSKNPRVFLYGQDIEDPKGDVFGVTKGLSTEFPERVVNSPLTESTIIGSSIGRALTGATPVAFMQFADFIPLAFNQIVSELATMHWRTAGEWQSPVIIMISCGAYRPGLGHFHANTYEATFSHIPGLDVMMPSTSADAAELLMLAFESKRPTLFFYPKSLLNIEPANQHAENPKLLLGYAKARQLAKGDKVTVVSWGSTVPICDQVVKSYAAKGVDCDFFDLRMMSPWDSESIIDSVSRTKRLLVCHEDNLSCGMGAEVVATVSEAVKEPIKVKRVTRPDVGIPYNYDNQLEIMPGFDNLVEAIADLLNLPVKWTEDTAAADLEGSILQAIGTGPSDDTVTVLEYFVEEGQSFEEGEPLVMVEANKAATDICANEAGTVLKLLVDIDEIVKVGEPLMTYSTEGQESASTHQTKAIISPFDPIEFELPIIKNATTSIDNEGGKQELLPPVISLIEKELGAIDVPNSEVIKEIENATEARIERLTGVSSRPWVNDEQSLISMAVNATRKVLEKSELKLSDIDKLIVATGTADKVIPSVASSIQISLFEEFGEIQGSAFDINAACSGYVYGLETAYHYLIQHPQQRILLISAEVFSDKLDSKDGGTYLYFSDTATASLISGGKTNDPVRAELTDCYIGSTPDMSHAIALPLPGKGHLKMNGEEVFPASIRSMMEALHKVCAQQGISLHDVDLIVPHQSSQKVINVLGKELESYHLPVYSNITHLGNSSSSTIPLALIEALDEIGAGKTVGLCTFGGGYTFGAAIIKT